MKTKSKFCKFKEAVKQKVEWIKDNPKEALKKAGHIIRKALPWVLVVVEMKKSSQKQNTIDTLSDYNNSLADTLRHKDQQIRDYQDAIEYLQSQEIENQRLKKRLASDALRHGSPEGGKTMNSLKGD